MGLPNVGSLQEQEERREAAEEAGAPLRMGLRDYVQFFIELHGLVCLLKGQDVDSDDGLHDMAKPKKKKAKKEKAVSISQPHRLTASCPPSWQVSPESIVEKAWDFIISETSQPFKA